MPETLAALFLAHVLADYVFQSSAMVADKRNPKVLLAHGVIVLLTAMATTGQLFAWPLLLYAGAHFAIDVIKTHLASDTIGPYLADQSAHLITLGLIALIAPDLATSGAWAEAPAWVYHAMLYVAGLICATRAGGFAVGKLMARFGDSPFEESLDRGGFWIGLLERGLIVLLILANMTAGIGFLVAAKSVLRFEAAQDARKAEWVIIGTLASFGWAIAVAVAMVALRDALPPL